MRRMFVRLVLVSVALASAAIISCIPVVAALAQTESFPVKGRPITIIVSFGAGGGTDIITRTMAPWLQQELGVPITVVNRPGAGSQIGLTELARSKPDGYTIGWLSLPSSLPAFLDPARGATFTRKSFTILGHGFDIPYTVVVNANSPYKTLQDLIDAAKAKPETLKAGSTGVLALGHQTGLLLEKAAGVKFAFVHFDGSGPATTALLGGHVECSFLEVTPVLQHVKGGTIRALGLAAKEESPDLPGVRTLEAQGYKVYMAARGLMMAPAGLPEKVRDVLVRAFKKVIENPEHKKKQAELGTPMRYLSPEESDLLWDEIEATVKPLIIQAK